MKRVCYGYVDRYRERSWCWDTELLTTFCKEAIIELLNQLDITPGKYTEVACQLEDNLRVSHAEHKSTPEVKKRCKVIRGLKKQKYNKNKQRE
jgi:hypothetical protein